MLQPAHVVIHGQQDKMPTESHFIRPCFKMSLYENIINVWPEEDTTFQIKAFFTRNVETYALSL